MLGPVVQENDPSQGLEPAGYVGFPEIRTADPVAQIQQEFGDAAHADAPDPDEMDVLKTGIG
jgi:hypothetical protein